MDVSENIKRLKDSRSALLKELQALDIKQLSTIPSGYNNNILWNLGHILVVPQYYFYASKGNNPHIDAYYIQHYMSGTRPRAEFVQEDFEGISQQLITILDRLESDYTGGAFDNFTAFGTMGFDGVLNFLANHDARHVGIITNMIRLVT